MIFGIGIVFGLVIVLQLCTPITSSLCQDKAARVKRALSTEGTRLGSRNRHFCVRFAEGNSNTLVPSDTVAPNTFQRLYKYIVCSTNGTLIDISCEPHTRRSLHHPQSDSRHRDLNWEQLKNNPPRQQKQINFITFFFSLNLFNTISFLRFTNNLQVISVNGFMVCGFRGEK